MTQRRFAEDSMVPVAQSQQQVQTMLQDLGAERMAIFTEKKGASIVFEAKGTYFRISTPRVGDWKGSPEQQERAVWRALHRLVHAKKIAIEYGITTIEREFMADTVMPDGTTLIDHHQAIIAHNYRDGGVPRLGFEP